MRTIDEAKDVQGPVYYPQFGWEVRLYFDGEEAARGFAAFAANGFKARQDISTATLLWVPASGGPSTGPLPPSPGPLVVYGVDTTSQDQVVKIEYSMVGMG